MKPSTKKILICAGLYIFTGALLASLFVWTPSQQDRLPLLRDFIIFFATILLTKYFVYMTIGPWNKVIRAYKEMTQDHRKKALYQPKVSVLVPAWNEEVGLINTIKTILQNTYLDFEVVVINDGSTDGSHAAMLEFLKTCSDKEKIIYRYKNNGGKGSALNHAVAFSSGELLISIDADCALTTTTIENFVKHFEDPKVMAAVGNVKIGNTQGILGTIQYLEFLFSFYFKNVDSLFNTVYIIGGAAGAFRRSVFEKIGLYSTRNITEDIDLSVRIQKAGMKIVYASDAVVYTEGATTLKGLMEQRLRWKRGRFQTFNEHRELFFSTKPTHNFLLSWLVLPFAIFGDTQLCFEVLFLMFLYVYAIFTHDFSSFVSGIVVVSSMFWMQLFEDTSPKRISFYVLAPIAWLLFYLTTLVEYRALLKSLWGMVFNQKLTWQKWERVGVFQ
jgi:biofilm PGA synthesis N-glycosyltransferase PgaC